MLVLGQVSVQVHTMLGAVQFNVVLNLHTRSPIAPKEFLAAARIGFHRHQVFSS